MADEKNNPDAEEFEWVENMIFGGFLINDL